MHASRRLEGGKPTIRYRAGPQVIHVPVRRIAQKLLSEP